jgi:hypothetical protein
MGSSISASANTGNLTITGSFVSAAVTSNNLVLENVGNTSAWQVVPTSTLKFYAGGSNVYPANPTISFSATPSNSGLVTLNSVDFAAPSFTTSSLGSRLILTPAVTASTVDYALGCGNQSLWYSVANSSSAYYWYFGTTSLLSLASTKLNFSGGDTFLGSNITYSGASLYGNTTYTGCTSLIRTYVQITNLNLGTPSVTFNGQDNDTIPYVYSLYDKAAQMKFLASPTSMLFRFSTAAGPGYGTWATSAVTMTTTSVGIFNESPGSTLDVSGGNKVTLDFTITIKVSTNFGGSKPGSRDPETIASGQGITT